MNFHFVFARDFNLSIKFVLNVMCLFFMFFVSANSVWGEISIVADGIVKPVAEWFGPPPSVTLDVGEFGKFKASSRSMLSFRV